MKRSYVRSSINSMGETIHIQAFVNVNAHPVGVRRRRSHDDSEKTGEAIGPGEPVVVEQVAEHDGVRFLKLADNRGWVFDSKDDHEVMAKMEDLEVGIAWYRVVCKELVDVRGAPVYDHTARTGRLLCPGELIAINLRCRVRGGYFVHLADGRGWVFVLKSGASRTNHDTTAEVLKECEAQLNGNTSVDLLNAVPPTTDIVEVGTWTYVVGFEPVLALGSRPNGTYLSPGDVVMVNKRAWGNGDPPNPHTRDYSKLWLRLNDGRGWVPEKGADGKALLNLWADSSMTYPKHFRGRLK